MIRKIFTKMLALVTIVLLLTVLYYTSIKLEENALDIQDIPENTDKKNFDEVIADGAKFSIEIITKPIVNTEVPFHFKIINGVRPPDPEICVLNITINGEIVLDEKTCIEENETTELIFDYESGENETEWKIIVFYSVDQAISNVTLFLREESVESGFDVTLNISLPEVVEKGKTIAGSGLFFSDSTNWIYANKIVLIIKKDDRYYNFEKILNVPIPSNSSYTANYTTKIPENAEEGDHTVQAILYYTENGVEKAVSDTKYVRII